VRWIRFSQQGRTAYGIQEDDRIREVAGVPFQGHEKTDRLHDLRAVKIEVPVVRDLLLRWPQLRRAHQEAAAKLGIADTQTADVGYRAVNALIAHEAGRHSGRREEGAVRGRAASSSASGPST
jgi:hypothetical protein